MKILLITELAPFPRLGGLAMHAITLGNYFIQSGHDVDFMGNAQYGSDENIRKMGFAGRLVLNDKMSISLWIKKMEYYINKYGGIYTYYLYKLIAKRIAKEIAKVGERYNVVHYHGHFPLVTKYVPGFINLVETRHDHGTICPNKLFLNCDQKICNVDAAQDPKNCAWCFRPNPNSFQKLITKFGCVAWRDEMREALAKHKHIFVSKRILDLALSVLKIGQTSNIHMIHNFINCRQIKDIMLESHSERLSSPKNQLQLLIANTIDPHKGIGVFLSHLEKKDKEMERDMNIVIAGDGRERKSLESSFSHMPVSFAGHLSHEQVLSEMYACDIYLLPSIWEESCSTSVLEALYLGKDVRALCLGGTPELVRYAQDPQQLQLFDSLSELVDSLYSDEEVYRSPKPGPAQFAACVDQKAAHILDVYLSS